MNSSRSVTRQYFMYGLSCVIVGAVLTSSVVYNLKSGYMLNREAFWYLAHYLGPKSVAEKIFDFRSNDTLPENYYRPRDVGNVFNYLDAELVLLSLRFGVRGLLSGVHYISLICFALMHMYFTRKYFGHSVYWIALFSLLLFLTSPGAFLTGTYIRTSKIVVSVFLTLIFWLVVGIFRRHTAYTKTIWILLFIVSVGMALTDEVGLALLLGFTIVSLFAFAIYRSKPELFLAFLFISAICATQVYRYMIGPIIVYRVTGIWPKIWDFNINPSLYLQVVYKGVIIFFDHIGLLFGNSPPPVSLLIFVALLITLIVICTGKTTASGWVKRGFWPMVFLTMSMYWVGVLVIMGATHTPLLEWINILRYYPIPFQALVTMVVGIIACKIGSHSVSSGHAILFLLSVVVLLNLLSLPIYTQSIATDYVQQYWGRNAKEVVDPALATEDDIIKTIDPNAWNYNAVVVIRSRLNK